MPPSLSDLDDTEASLSNRVSAPPLIDCLPLHVVSEICDNILGDIGYLQKLGHLPSYWKFRLTDNFGIRLEGLNFEEKAAGLAAEHRGKPREHHEEDLRRLRYLIEAVFNRPRICHCAFTGVEKTLKDLLRLAENSPTLYCRDLGELFLKKAHQEYAKDIKTARNLLGEIHGGSFWGDKNVAEATFPNVMARLLGCDRQTFEPANVFDEIGAISPNILSDILIIRSCNEPDSIDYADLIDVAVAARSLERKLDEIDRGLQHAIGLYFPTSDDN
ncbi:hypothetical protein X797_001689 [Metarhizium robertsii]|uniref:Small GTPase superfamily, ARF/SAR type n=2 Tax=Metarhizium robertsii TaxID=568076 RepID=A0A0B2X9N3_METRA|nr:Small GTPase superfamily, ARF/SAR type [Metarhizium robertsii ARSEF 23]EXV04019.1 hypothetical protein X797_001689 [Metarhizium robertsii]KHO11563.1 Small GTPase superfamily, ARF/SAR type [Metarhizium robertsii ARSEF 23]